MIIARKDEVIIRELEKADFSKLVEYADNENVSINLFDAFPLPYTNRFYRIW
ncbi:MAG: hypothetical protein H6567_07365 [Lewinellaceae bacterium]|nr:hypothetical protein [Lewinellaceae bacterium]